MVIHRNRINYNWPYAKVDSYGKNVQDSERSLLGTMFLGEPLPRSIFKNLCPFALSIDWKHRVYCTRKHSMPVYQRLVNFISNVSLWFRRYSTFY